MKKSTRRFVFVAAGILVFGLGTGLLASYVGGFQNIVLIGRDGPAELDYIPADAGAVAYANVREVMDSELRKKLMQQFHPNLGSDADQFQQQTGINLQTDVDQIVGTVAGAGANQRPLLIARGRFDNTTLEGFARQHGAVVEEYKGRRFLAHPDGEVAIAFVEPGIVAVGGPAAVRRAIDAKDDGNSVRKNDELMRQVRDIDGGNVWAIANFDAITGGRQLPPEIVSQLPPITWVSASSYINGGVRGTVRAEARDEQSANDLRQVLQGFVALARLQVGKRPEFADLLNSLQLGGTGNTVSLQFTVPSELIDAFAAMAALQKPQEPEIRQQLRPLPAL